MSRWLRRAAISVGLGFLLALLAAAPAQAHAVLVESDPPSSAILQEAPKQVKLAFNEPVSRVGDGVTVIAPDGDIASQGKASSSDGGRKLSARLGNELPQGTYLVSYRLVSADGHPISGGYTFSIGRESKTPQAPDSVGDSVDPVVRGVMSVGRYAGYLGAALLAGSALMLTMLWPRRLPVTRPARLGWLGWGALASGTVLCLWAQVPYGYGGDVFTTDGEAWSSTLTSTLGIALLVRLALLVAAVPLLRRVFAGEELGRAPRWALLIMAVGALLTWPFAGHAANSVGKFLSIPADALHVGAMAVWLGGLLILVTTTLGRDGANDTELDAILPTWSRWALQAIAVVVFTGAIEALLEVGRLAALTSTRYGVLVLLKVAGVLVVFCLAAVARRVVMQRLRTAGTGARLVRRVVVAEVVVAALILGVATALSQTPPAGTASEPAIEKGAGFGVALDADGTKIDFQLDPARTGANSMHLYAYDENGQQKLVLEWQTSLALPSKDVAPISVPLIAISDNHATGEIYVPSAGEWEFRITIRTSETDQTTVKQLVDIE